MWCDMNEVNKWQYEQAVKDADAIFHLEGFEKTEMMRKIDEAISLGKASAESVYTELLAYIEGNKTVDGFLDGKEWAN